MNPKFKVVATWGAQEYTTELGEFGTMEEAMDRVNRWHEAPQVKGMKIDLLEVLKVTNVTVWQVQPTTWTETAVDYTASAVDYERVGVKGEISPAFAGTRTQPNNEQVRDTFQPFDDLQDTVRHLEDRHVGLRNDVMLDINEAFEHIGELKDNVAEDMTELRSNVYTLQDDVLAYKEVTEELKRDVSNRILEHTTNFGGALENFETEVEKDMEALRSEIETLRNERKV